MPRKRNIHRYIEDPLFKASVHVFVGDFQAVIRYCKGIDMNTEKISAAKAAKTLFLTHSDGRDSVVLWFLPEYAHRAGVVAHEVHHAAEMILTARGVTDQAICGEVGAYYVEWLMEKVTKIIVGKK